MYRQDWCRSRDSHPQALQVFVIVKVTCAYTPEMAGGELSRWRLPRRWIFLPKRVVSRLNTANARGSICGS